ncbi:hypothetical protein pipiens_006359, partial [Culex pipiens pipiens]
MQKILRNTERESGERRAEVFWSRFRSGTVCVCVCCANGLPSEFGPAANLEDVKRGSILTDSKLPAHRNTPPSCAVKCLRKTKNAPPATPAVGTTTSNSSNATITMSATMRTTLQTVPESLPADHVTNAGAGAGTGGPVQGSGTQTEVKSHSHTTASAGVKTRQSSSK